MKIGISGGSFAVEYITSSDEIALVAELGFRDIGTNARLRFVLAPHEARQLKREIEAKLTELDRDREARK